jgi:hypothetical protein
VLIILPGMQTKKAWTSAEVGVTIRFRNKVAHIHMSDLSQAPAGLVDALAAIVGRDNVITDSKRREIYGTDIFYKRTPPLLGVRPRSSSEVPVS